MLVDESEKMEYLRLQHALEFARNKHQGQTRDQGTPYVHHSEMVAYIVLNAGGTLNEAIAAVLHDILEDTDAGPDDIHTLFGDEVLYLVEVLTKEKDEKRKIYLEKFKYSRVEVRRIKVADRIHNLMEMDIRDIEWQKK